MIDRHLARALFVIAFAIVFGLGSLQYKIGTLSHAGPGLFPLLVSIMVGVIGVVMLVQSRFAAREALELHPKNIGILLLALCGFAVASHFVNMTLGIVFMVFTSTLAGASYSVWRNLKISVVLVAVAFAFQKLLGLNLPLL